MELLLKSILGQPSPLVLLLYGTHGTELPGSIYVARRLASSIGLANPLAVVDLIGPVSPWACRRGYRYDRYLSDPNRFYIKDNANLAELTHFLALWQKHKPKSRKELVCFFQESDLYGLHLDSVFQMGQASFPGLPGFVHLKIQQRRVSYLVQLMLKRHSLMNFSSIVLLDVHAGIGQHASTRIFYSRRKDAQERPFLVDILAARLESLTRCSVQAMISETGVINNEAGMIDALSELAFRTHGYSDQRNLQLKAMDYHWKAKVAHYLELQFAVY